MELPSHLLRTYRKYKLQEQDLLQWIVENSRLAKSAAQQNRTLKLSSRARVPTGDSTQQEAIQSDAYESPAGSSRRQTDQQDVIGLTKDRSSRPCQPVSQPGFLTSNNRSSLGAGGGVSPSLCLEVLVCVTILLCDACDDTRWLLS